MEKTKLNRYGNIAGCHTPQLSEAVLYTLKCQLPNYNFVDAAWHNDAADSFEFYLSDANIGDQDPQYTLWLPSDEAGGTFIVMSADYDRLAKGKTLDEVLEWIKGNHPNTYNLEDPLANVSDYMQALVDSYTDGMFEACCEEYELEYGDISPHQIGRLERIQKDLADILEEFTRQNI